MKSHRREFVKNVAGGIGLLSLQAITQMPGALLKRQLKIACVGGHPDDPETGCGGILARFSELGHSVTIIYLTRGEAGIPGKSYSEAAKIRTKEAEAACAILKGEPVFLGQIDGNTMVNSDWINKLQSLLEKLQPDIVFTHWPIDDHIDHQSASLLTMQSYFRMQRSFLLYFFEVCIGHQTNVFRPTEYVDITEVQAQKRKAVFAHVSQNPSLIYSQDHDMMEAFRGREMGTKAAEAFVKMIDFHGAGMPGLF
ncbi:MAG TPA: PIG-L family deacetylase [Niabella sp.]|nr:PIG-L family deacetylase [Niabella sp.]